MNTINETYLFENLERVHAQAGLSPATPATVRRYELDGLDCTSQVQSLVARQRISVGAEGSLERHTMPRDKTGRQLPSPEALELLRSTLMASSPPHRDPQSASARARRRG